MRKVRFFLSLVLVLAMMLASPLSAFAEVWYASTSDDVQKAFDEDEDAEVIINMQNDIEMEVCLTANDGQNYTFNGNGYTLYDVNMDGEGTVVINADVTGEDTSALIASGNVNITVNGDVSGDYYYFDSGSQYGTTGIEAYDEAEITVDGNVTGGSVEGDKSTGGYAIVAQGDAKVTVTGDVTGGSGTLSDEELQVEESYSDGNDAISASDQAEVTVKGNVSGGDGMGSYAYGGNGISAMEDSTVTVGGDVTGGSVTADPAVESIHPSIAGTGIEADTGATVTVGGNVSGGDSNANGGIAGDGIALKSSGIYDEEAEKTVAYETPGTVTVNGTVTGGAGGEGGTDGVALAYRSNYDYSDYYLEQLLKTPADEISDYGLYTMQYYVINVLNIDQDDLDAYLDLYEDKIDAAEEDSDEWVEACAECYQHILKNELPKADLEDVAEYGFADVTVFALSDENGGMVGSLLGSDCAEKHSAENTTYIIKAIQPKGGSITVDKTTAMEGDTVTATVKVEDGYILKGVYCGTTQLTASANGTYSYVVPAGGGVEFSAVTEAILTNGNPNTGDGSSKEQQPPAATPSTGDGFHMLPVILLTVVSLFGFCVMIPKRKKFVK